MATSPMSSSSASPRLASCATRTREWCAPPPAPAVSTDPLTRSLPALTVTTACALQVSMYMYNRFTKAESFKAYVRRSYRAYSELNEKGRWGNPRDGEWEVFCHRLPMHLFTHDGARQLVGHVVRMEDFSVIIDPSRGKVGPRSADDTGLIQPGLIQQWRPGPWPRGLIESQVRLAAVAHALSWQPAPEGPHRLAAEAC